MVRTSSAGKPRALSTITIVTRPACGILAAPIDANVDVKLNDPDFTRPNLIMAPPTW